MSKERCRFCGQQRTQSHCPRCPTRACRSCAAKLRGIQRWRSPPRTDVERKILVHMQEHERADLGRDEGGKTGP